jgi:hypothetical protein
MHIHYNLPCSTKNTNLEDTELSVEKPKENYFIFLCILFVKRVECVCLKTKYVTHLLSCYLYFPVLGSFTSYVYKRFPYLNSLVLNCYRNEYRQCDKGKHTRLMINKGIKNKKIYRSLFSFPFITLHPTSKIIFTLFYQCFSLKLVYICMPDRVI